MSEVTFDWNFGDRWCNGCHFHSSERMSGRHWCRAMRSENDDWWMRDIPLPYVMGGVVVVERPEWCPYRKADQVCVRPTGNVTVVPKQRDLDEGEKSKAYRQRNRYR